MNRPVSWKMEGNVFLIEVDNPPVNALGKEVRTGLNKAISAASEAEQARVVLIICKGKTFFVGADITELDGGISKDVLLDFTRACNELPIPVVCAMHGNAFGGGVVIALACDYRLAMPGTRFALPEVKLGLLPACGCTQTLPRLISVSAALDLMLFGDPIDCEKALREGLIDDVLDGDLLLSALSHPLVKKPREKRVVMALPPSSDKESVDFIKIQTEIPKNNLYRARSYCVELVEKAVRLPVSEVLDEEYLLFQRLIASEESKELRKKFVNSKSN